MAKIYKALPKFSCTKLIIEFSYIESILSANQKNDQWQKLVTRYYDSAKVFCSIFSSFRIVNIWFIETLQKLIHSGIIQICACVALTVASAPHKTFHLIRSKLM